MSDFDDLGSFLDQHIQQDNALKARAAVGAPVLTPDQAAKAVSLGQQTGAPPALVAGDVQGWDQTARQAADSQVINSNPDLAAHFASTPMAAEVSQDDVGPLGRFIQLVRKGQQLRAADDPGGQVYARGYEQQNYARAAAGNQLGVVPDSTLEGYEKDLAQPINGEDKIPGLMKDALTFLGQMTSSAQVALPAAGAGFLAGGPAGAAAAGGVALKGDMALAASGQVYRSLQLDQNGNQIPEAVKQTAAVAAGVGTYVLAGVGQRLIGSAISKAFSTPETAFILRKALTDVAAGATEGAAVNAGMQIASSASEQLAKAYPGGIPTVFNSAEERGKFIDNVVEAAKSGAALFGAMKGIGIAAGPIADKMQAARAENNANHLDQVFQAGDETATKERSPDMAAAAATRVLGNETVSIPAEVAAQHPEIRALPRVEEQMELALGTGGDVAVPAGEFVGRVPTETYKAVRDEVSMGGTPSLTDAAEAPKPIDANPRWTGLGEQIALPLEQTRKALFLDPIFKDGESLGITEKEFQQYSDGIQSKQAAIEKSVFDAVEKFERRTQTKEWKTNEGAVREETAVDIARRPDIAADEYFRTGLDTEGNQQVKIKLDRDAVNELFSKDEAYALGHGGPMSNTLARGTTAAKAGIHPDAVADLFGFASGKEMVRAMADLQRERSLRGESPGAFKDRQVAEETGRRMDARYGNVNENVVTAAIRAMMDTKQVDLLTDDMNMIGRQVGERPMTLDDVKAKVRGDFDNLPSKKGGDVEGFQRLIARNGRKAEQALLSKKLPDAFKSKQFQVYNTELARNAQEFRGDLKRLEKTIDRYANGKKPPAPSEFSDQIQKILLNIGFDVKKSNTDMEILQKSPAFTDFVSRMNNDEGLNVPSPSFLSLPDRQQEKLNPLRIIPLRRSGR